MKVSDRFSADITKRLRCEIADALGNEILCAGQVDRDGIVNEIVIGARGNDISVPALLPYMEQGHVVIHNHPSGGLEPSEADLKVASYLGNQGIGFFIVNNDVTKVYVVAEPVKAREILPLETESLKKFLEPGSPIDREMAYERRQSQIDMLCCVIEAFNGNMFCLAEAGTGVGKSFAYLVPSIEWAGRNKEKVVISTGTINLQTQLIEKDIPLVQRILGSKIKAVLVKGRGNYLCFQRLEDAMREKENALFSDEADDLAAVRDWTESATHGSLNELSFVPAPELWSRINSESDHCLGLKCRFRDSCFVLKARKEAGSADILVVNHHLLFADIAIRHKGIGYDTTAVLPPYRRIVFDEAHNIENSATSFFSRNMTRYAVLRQLNRLYGKGKTASGIIIEARKFAPLPDSFIVLPSMIEKVKSDYDESSIRMIEYFTEGTVLHIDKGLPSFFHDILEAAMAGLQKDFLALADALCECYTYVPEPDREEPSVHEMYVIAKRLRSFADLCLAFRTREANTEDVFWIEKLNDRKGNHYLRFNQSPIDVGPLLQEALYETMDTLVFSSATLAVNGSFDYWKNRVGLTQYPGKEISGIFPSPFPYDRNVILGIPRDAPDPADPGYIRFFNSFARKLVEISEGKGLLLFTSYSMLKACYDELAPVFRDAGYRPLRQGDDDRGRLLETFKRDVQSVLFATDSFWEGIDSPGETLQILIISRLPFRVPNEPVIKARCEAIAERGGNPFYELSLPDAVIKLKQGFGRLIRHSSDRGAVIIADNRLLVKNYGRIFLESLPQTKESFTDSLHILNDVENFFY